MRSFFRSEYAALFVGPAPAYRRHIYHGASSLRRLSKVQSVSYGFDINREEIKQLGHEDLLIREINITQANPTPGSNIDVNIEPVPVNFSFEYFPTCGYNEYLLNFNVVPAGETASNSFISRHFGDKNFFLVLRDDIGKEARFLQNDEDFFGHYVIGIGNAFATRHSISTQVGSPLRASFDYEASNIKVDMYSGSNYIPAIHLYDGKYKEEYKYNFNQDSFGQEYGEAAILSNNIKISIEPTNIGGPALGKSNVNAQSFSIDLNMSRRNLYGFGSMYPTDRRLELPVRGALNFGIIKKDLETGNLNNILFNDKTYKVKIDCYGHCMNDYCDPESRTQELITYVIDNAVFKNKNTSLVVKDYATVDVGFDFTLTHKNGFLISGGCLDSFFAKNSNNNEPPGGRNREGGGGFSSSDEQIDREVKIYNCGEQGVFYSDPDFGPIPPEGFDVEACSVVTTYLPAPGLDKGITDEDIMPIIIPSPPPTPSPTASPTQTPSITPTISFTPSFTPSPTISPSQTPSFTPTPTRTPSNSPSVSITPSATITPTTTPSFTSSVTVTPSVTSSTTSTPSVTSTVTPSKTPDKTPTTTPTPTHTPTLTPTCINTILNIKFQDQSTYVVEGDNGIVKVERELNYYEDNYEGPFKVDYKIETEPYSAVSGYDFIGKIGTLEFAEGENEKFIEFSTIEDYVDESSEIFKITINPQHINCVETKIKGNNPYHVVIVDDDQIYGNNQYVRFDYSSTYVVEGNTAVVTVYRHEASDSPYEPFHVDYITEEVSNSAVKNQDYVHTFGRLEFAKDEMTKTIEIQTLPIDGERDHEMSEFFNIKLYNVVSYSSNVAIVGSNPYSVFITEPDE